MKDLKEFWLDLKKGVNVLLWCDALRDNKKKCGRRRTFEGSDSDDDQKVKCKKKRVTTREKDGRVQETIDNLKNKHGESAFTMMQFRIWSEMLQSGMHASYTDPPNSSMFQRAGGKDTPKRKSENVAEIVAQATSQAIAATLTPKPSSSLGASPGRVIDNRSKCYRQLSEIIISRPLEYSQLRNLKLRSKQL